MKFLQRTNPHWWAALSGLLLGLAFPPLDLGILAFVGFVPFLAALLRSRSALESCQYSFSCVFVWHGIAHAWLLTPGLQGDSFLLVTALLFWLINPLLYCIPTLVFHALARSLGPRSALPAVPLVWSSYEWLRELGDFWTPDLALAYTQAYNQSFIQAAELCGAWGIGFIILAVNVLLLRMMHILRDSGSASALSSTAFRLHAAALLLLLALPLVYGFSVLRHAAQSKLPPEDDSSRLRVGVVQPGMDPWEKWEVSPDEHIQRHREAQAELLAGGPAPDIMVWSETALTFHVLEAAYSEQLDSLRAMCRRHDMALISGFADRRLYPAGTPAPLSAQTIEGDSSAARQDLYNAMLLLKPGQPVAPGDIYRKIRLTPFAERLPYPGLLTWLRPLFDWDVGVWGWAPGTEQNLLELNADGRQVRIGPAICIESIYPEYVAEFVRKGANLLLVASNDAWYDGSTGPGQHYAMAILRAVETRRSIVRCANSGVSGFISPMGESLLELDNGRTGAIAHSVVLREGQTAFVRYGHLPPRLCTLLVVALLLYCWWSRKKDR